jgi:hypothetical protein
LISVYVNRLCRMYLYAAGHSSCTGKHKDLSKTNEISIPSQIRTGNTGTSSLQNQTFWFL